MSKAEMWLELVPQACSDILPLHISWQKMCHLEEGCLRQENGTGPFIQFQMQYPTSYLPIWIVYKTVPLCHILASTLNKKVNHPKTCQKDVCVFHLQSWRSELSLKPSSWKHKYHDTQRVESWLFFSFRWRLWPWQHFDSDHARDVRTRQVVQLLSWLDSKLLKTYGT